jgi:hypothetical protein
MRSSALFWEFNVSELTMKNIQKREDSCLSVYVAIPESVKVTFINEAKENMEKLLNLCINEMTTHLGKISMMGSFAVRLHSEIQSYII